MNHGLHSFLKFEKLLTFQSFRDYISYINGFFKYQVDRTLVEILNNELCEENFKYCLQNNISVHNMHFSFPIYCNGYRCIIYSVDREESPVYGNSDLYLLLEEFNKYDLTLKEKFSKLFKNINCDFGFYDLLNAFMWDYGRTYDMFISIVDSSKKSEVC